MYWGDAYHDLIETAYLDGTGRRTILSETESHYFAFVLHDGDIYFTDWIISRYVCFVHFHLLAGKR